MSKHTRAGPPFALAVTGLALGVTLAPPADVAAKAPGFLAAAHLLPHPSSSWTAVEITADVPEALE
ncbi:hypothetical protein [Streptomyces sp. YIM S03343]